MAEEAKTEETQVTKTEVSEAQTKAQDHGKTAEESVSVEWHNRVKRERDEAQAALRKYEEERAAAERKRLEEAGEHKKLADSAQAERDKALKARDELQSSYTQRILRRELRAVAAAAGLENLDDVQYVNLDGVEYDAEKDAVVGAKEAVEKWKASHPRFFKPESLEPDKAEEKKSSYIPPGAANGKGAQKDAFAMSEDEYAAEFHKRFPSLT